MYEERYKPERMASECFCFYFIRKKTIKPPLFERVESQKMAERKSADVVASSPPCSCQKERSGHSHVTPLLRDSVNLVSSSPSPSATHSPPLPLNFSFRRLLGLHFCFSLLLLFAFVLFWGRAETTQVCVRQPVNLCMPLEQQPRSAYKLYSTTHTHSYMS